MDTKQKTLADIWLLIASLNCVRYAITELNPDAMPSQGKVKYKNLKSNIENFLNSMQLKTDLQNRKKLIDTNFENVGAMVETMSMLAHVPLTHIEPFLDRVNQLVFEIIKEIKNEKDSNDRTD